MSLMLQDLQTLDQNMGITNMVQDQEVGHTILTEQNTGSVQGQGHIQEDIVKENILIQDQEAEVTTNTLGPDQDHHIIKGHPDTLEAEAEIHHQLIPVTTKTTRNDMVMVEVIVDHHQDTEEEEGNTRILHQCQTDEDM